MQTEPSVRVTIPNVTLSLDQLLVAIRQLDERSLSQIAQAILEKDRDVRLIELIRRLSQRDTALTTDVSDDVINAEVQAVSQARIQRNHA
ncbi:MAG TPA: hypothetical protein VGK87_04995 [Anaerolineae bacterium]|jgi:uncharacterized membrane protein YcaP (DUF421 family)